MSTSKQEKDAQTLANLASERAVLSGICRYGIDSYVEVSPIVEENTFTLNINKIIYKCVSHVLKTSSSIDFSSILSAAHELNLTEHVNTTDSLKHIRAILETPINIENVFEHASKIRRLQFGREIQHKLRDIYRSISGVSGSESLAHIMSLAETPIQEISLQYLREDKTTPKEISTNLDDYIQNLIDNPCTQVGISTGLPSFDKAIGGGLRRKCVDVIGARSKAGKSVLGDVIAVNVTRMGVPVLMLDTEMSEEDHFNRILANMSGIEINEIATGAFAKDPIKLQKLLAAKNELKKLPYYYMNISGRPFDETMSIIKRWLLKVVGYDENSRMKDCLVIYDYLKLMSASDMGNDMKEYQVLGFQITQLHNLAVEYDFPCLTYCQLNRDGITKEDADAISGSDRIIWLCTSFSILKKKTEEEIATDGIRAGNRKLIPVVSRHGPGMEEGGYICLQMDGALARISHVGFVRELNKTNEFQKRVADPKDEDGDEMENFD